MAHCGKCNTLCGALNANITGFHEAAILAHPFHQQNFFNNVAIGTAAPVLNTAASVQEVGIIMINYLIQVSKSKANQVMCTFQTSTPNAGKAALVCALGEVLGLKFLGIACLVAMYHVF